jgi:hypothetical protein
MLKGAERVSAVREPVGRLVFEKESSFQGKMEFAEKI